MFLCSCSKIIGARYYRADLEPLNKADFLSPRYSQGHGTHTTSTVTGNPFTKANMLGFGEGTIREGSTPAQIAVYDGTTHVMMITLFLHLMMELHMRKPYL